MEDTGTKDFLNKALSKNNRIQLIKTILGGALMGVGAALTFVFLLNVFLELDLLSDRIISFFSGL